MDIFCSRRNRHARDLSFDEIVSSRDDGNHAQVLAQKSGFVSLKDRMNSLLDQEAKGRRAKDRKVNVNSEDGRKSNRQFANLHELFASRSGHPRNSSPNQDDTTTFTGSSQYLRRSKIPVMKLSKDDWNVRCWEERLRSHKRRQQDRGANSSRTAASKAELLKPKPESQLEVFKERIDDVALKLEKVREGLPLDEQLYDLVTNKGVGRETKKSSHEWTDLLKRELENGAHNSRQLQSNLANNNQDSNSFRSPLGRPIRKIYQDDDEED